MTVMPSFSASAARGLKPFSPWKLPAVMRPPWSVTPAMPMPAARISGSFAAVSETSAVRSSGRMSLSGQNFSVRTRPVRSQTRSAMPAPSVALLSV